jgi:hypothetical protein
MQKDYVLIANESGIEYSVISNLNKIESVKGDTWYIWFI